MRVDAQISVILLCLFHGCLAQWQVRLIPPSNDPNTKSRGTVQVRDSSSSSWGTVCDDGWDLPDANVVCKMLGYPSATTAHTDSYFGTTPEAYVLKSVDCNGDEDQLKDCSHQNYGEHNCDKARGEDAGVTCFVGVTTPTTVPPTIGGCVADSNIRIVGGPNAAVGRVEISRSGFWGTVCDDGFDFRAAQVVCKSLCYGQTYAKPYYESTVAQGSGPIYLDDLRCSGQETSLELCPANKTASDCTHKEDAMVNCINYSEGAAAPPEPDVICHDLDMEVAFDRVIHNSLQENHLSLLDQQTSGCTVSKTTNSTHIAMLISYNGCTNKIDTNSTHIIYWVSIKHDIKTVGGITRTHVFTIHARCAFRRDTNSSQVFRPVEQTAPPQINNGEFTADLLLYTDDNFATQIVTYPHNVTLGAWLNAAVVLRTSDPDLKQVVPDCWATNTANSSAGSRYPLITDKCADDPTLALVPLNSTMFGFRLRSFDFVKNSSLVYIHCQVYVCTNEEKSAVCDQTCNTKRKRRETAPEQPGHIITHVHVAQGPLMLVHEVDATGEGNYNQLIRLQVNTGNDLITDSTDGDQTAAVNDIVHSHSGSEAAVPISHLCVITAAVLLVMLPYH